jgi:hypothetical protein
LTTFVPDAGYFYHTYKGVFVDGDLHRQSPCRLSLFCDGQCRFWLRYASALLLPAEDAALQGKERLPGDAGGKI